MSQLFWTWSKNFSIPSVFGAGKTVLDELLGQLQLGQWNEHDTFCVHLAVEEALANAIRHGNRLDESKRVRVGCRLADDRVWIEISDEGGGFDPEQLPDPTCEERREEPCGRGVHLMRNFMSRVEFMDRGKRVVMEKHRRQNVE